MRGVYCDGSSILLRRDLPEPSPQADEIVLRVRAVGICDTDVQLARGYMGFRGILGHEFIAEDEAGARFTAEINNSCHRCPTCTAGRPNHCPHRTVLGILGHDGAMADRVAVPRRNLHPIPDAIDDLAALFVEPLAAAFRVAEQVPLGPEIRVAVVGDGKLGILCAWVARLKGASVHLIGKHRDKLALAGPGVAASHRDDAGPLARSFDVVVDATGSTSGLETALGLVEPCGTVVLKTTVAGTHATSLSPIVIDEVRVVGSRCGPFPPAIAALETGEIDVRPLIDSVLTLDAAGDAFRLATSPGARKVVMTAR